MHPFYLSLIGTQYGELESIRHNGFPNAGNFPRDLHDEPAYGLRLDLSRPAREDLPEIVEGGASGNLQSSGGKFLHHDDIPIILVLNFPHQFLKDIFQGDDPFRSAKLIHYDSEVDPPFLKLLYHLSQLGAFRNKVWRLKVVFQEKTLRSGSLVHEEVFYVEDSHHLIQVFPEHRQPAVATPVGDFDDPVNIF